MVLFPDMIENEESKLFSQESSSDVKVTGKPYSSIEVSSNESNAFKLTDGNASSCWQSDGPARSHWIRWAISLRAQLQV